MNVNIRELSSGPEEIKRVQRFLFDMIKLEFGYDCVPEWHQDIVNIDEYYINPKRNAFFVAYSEDGKIIGTIGIRAYDKDFKQFRNIYSKENTSSIWRLFVDRRYRRCGLASKMFNIAENFGRENGYSNIYLHTHHTYKGAFQFWTKMGFVTTLDEDDELETIHMEKYIKELKISPQEGVLTYAIKI